MIFIFLSFHKYFYIEQGSLLSEEKDKKFLSIDATISGEVNLFAVEVSIKGHFDMFDRNLVIGLLKF